jgi:hypothetical protein
MHAAAMNASANENEVRLRGGTSLNERLLAAGFAVLLCLAAIPGIVASTDGQWPGIAATVALLIGFLLLGGAILVRSVVWIITQDGILIGEQRPFGQLHSRLIRNDEISEMHLRKDSANPAKFSIAFKVGSGDVVTSPPLPDVTKVHETAVRIARLLQLPDPEPPDNPLDAINTEIRLGEPVHPRRGREHRVLIVLLGCVLSFPFVHALWNGELSILGVTVWSLGAIVAVVLFRYAPRMGGTFWIIRDGGIRVERLSLNNAVEVHTIGGRDVEAIDIEHGSEEGSDVIAIRLHTGTKIRSPRLASKDQAQALRAEIIRRLRLNSSSAG